MNNGLSERLHRSLHELGKLMFQGSRIGVLSRAEFKILFSINKMEKTNKNATTAELSERLYISKPAISQMVNLLEDRGLLSREISKEDRRVILLKLTDKGQTTIDEGIRIYMEMMGRTLEEMGEDSAEEFINLFERFIECVKKVKTMDGAKEE